MDAGEILLETIRSAYAGVRDARAEAPRSAYAGGYLRRLPVQRAKIAPWYYPRIRARVIKAVCALAALVVAGYMAYTVFF
jgi:hypothetical protein